MAKLEARRGRGDGEAFEPSTNGGQALPIMDREGIRVAPMPGKGATWCAIALGRIHERANGGRGTWVEGPTPLIAAMRAYVLAQLGPEVELEEFS